MMSTFSQKSRRQHLTPLVRLTLALLIFMIGKQEPYERKLHPLFVSAWTTSTVNSRQGRKSCCLNLAEPSSSRCENVYTTGSTSALSSTVSSRCDFLTKSLTLLANGGIALTSLPRDALAIDVSETGVAFRRVEMCLKKLTSSNYANMIATSDYSGIRASFRDAPFSDFRKACSTLLKATTPVYNENSSASGLLAALPASTLQAEYEAARASLEQLDGLAGLGVRGRQLSEGELQKAYNSLESSLEVFIKAAKTSIPTLTPTASVTE